MARNNPIRETSIPKGVIVDDATRLKQLQAEHQRIRKEIGLIEDAQHRKQNEGLVGKCFKHRSSYSMPQSKKDYWWVYVKVTGMTRGGMLKTLTFEHTSTGIFEVEQGVLHASSLLGNGYEQIPLSRYRQAFRAFQKKLGKLL